MTVVVFEDASGKYQIPGLERVGERHPRKVTKREHESKSIVDDIHSRKDALFVV